MSFTGFLLSGETELISQMSNISSKQKKAKNKGTTNFLNYGVVFSSSKNHTRSLIKPEIYILYYLAMSKHKPIHTALNNKTKT